MSRLTESRFARTIFTLATVFTYLVAFFLLYPRMGLGVTILTIIPVVASAWLWGLWPGLLAGLLFLPINTILLNLVGHGGGWDVIVREAGGLGSVALILVGIIVGRLRDLGQEVNRQLTERKKAEEMLRLVQEELEVGVKEKTVDLVKANESLQAEIAEHKRTEKHLDHLAYHDHLTGLANHTLFRDQLTQALARALRNDQLVAIMFLDLDRFQGINETYGHTVGDRLLKKAAERLVECVRTTDTVARWGGGEFSFILEGILREQSVAVVAQKAIDAINLPFTVDDHEIFVTISIGITIYPHDGEDVDTLMKNADAAMSRAKERGRNTYRFYAPDMNTKALERLSLEGRLRRALEREEFALNYQPRVALDSGQMIGMEVLLRWRNSELGDVSPGQFIPLAEDTGLIVPISEWVLHTACAQNRAWQEAGLSPLNVSVNLSARQFRQKGLKDTITRVLQDTNLEPKHLELELTEGLLMEDTKASSTTLTDLKAMGLHVSVDDFGTGYSSLSYLKRFSLDTLKIDQSFVHDITSDADSAAIANSIIALARSLRMRVVAEGVETEEQLDFLRTHDCDEIQGYLYSRPLPTEAFEQLMREGKELAREKKV